jgi:hypothetical protein
MSPEEPRDYCPRCGVAYAPLQEYCLECGERLPTNRGVVGVLVSSQYSSLHPDYLVVFQGIYETQADAQAALSAAHAKGYTGAYQTRVTR